MDALLRSYLRLGLVRPCESPYCSPVFLARERGAEPRLVQDLKAVNQLVEDAGPVGRDPHALLSTLPAGLGWFSVLSLQDAFRAVPLSPAAQPLFAFDWAGRRHCWTVLPPGFKNAPALFEAVFARDLRELRLEAGVALHHAGRVLVASASRAASHRNTVRALNFLADRGYKVRRRGQFSQETARFLGVDLSRGRWRLPPEQCAALAATPAPAGREQLRSFLGRAGCGRPWVANFGLVVKPLCEALAGGAGPFCWTAECAGAFEDIKGRLARAPALSLPDPARPFHLFVLARRGVGLGLLAQELQGARRPVAYCSKQLDAAARGWPACLQAVAAAHELLLQARRLTAGQGLTVHVPHDVPSLLAQRARGWLGAAQLDRCRAALLGAGVRFRVVPALDPATLLPGPRREPAHDCLRTLRSLAGRPDLAGQPLDGPELEVFAAGRRFVKRGQPRAGYAVVSPQQDLEAGALPPGTSAQKAELVALTRALVLSRAQRVNVYTDSDLALAVVHTRGASLPAGVKAGLHAGEVLALLQAVQLPREVAVVHCLGHRQADSTAIRENRRARHAAKHAARAGALPRTPQVAPLEALASGAPGAGVGQAGRCQAAPPPAAPSAARADGPGHWGNPLPTASCWHPSLASELALLSL